MSAGAYPTAGPAQSHYPPASTNQGYYNAPQPYNNAQYPNVAYAAQPPYAQSPPQIRNPFAPPPAQTRGYNGSLYGGDYDPETQQQMAQWQAQYGTDTGKQNTGKAGTVTTANANHTPLGSGGKASDSKPAVAAPDKQQTVIRAGGGQTWEDPTLLEWGNHHRLFVGNLAGEVTDESLLKAFSKYPSVQKARVVRDKRTTKSKGFGFVSLADSDEFFQAAKEMQGKYIGSHPVLIKKADTEIKSVTKKDDRGRNGKYKGKSGNGGKKDKDNLGANTGGGVKKNKVEGKYKVLG